MHADAEDRFLLGELVVQNGRHAGSRRPLTGPVTLIGRAAGCDIRLQGEGVSPRHCLLAQTPHGMVLRDLQSDRGTCVNGERVTSASLRDGDVIVIGAQEFLVQGLGEAVQDADASEKAAQEEERQREAWRVQVAAVAAQQTALEEEEVKLRQRQHALVEQESQLASHLEAERQKLLALSAETRAERQRLEGDRAAHQTHVAKAAAALNVAQHELQKSQKAAEQERDRFFNLTRRLKTRWHRFWEAERKKLRARQLELEEEARRLDDRAEDLHKEEARLNQKRLQFNTLYEYGRGRLRESWTKLRQEQYHWKHRRGKERAALKVRDRDLEHAEAQLVSAQRLFLLDKRAWDAKKQALANELAGLNQRISNQRAALLDDGQKLRHLEEAIQAKQALAAMLPPAAPASPPPAEVSSLATNEPRSAGLLTLLADDAAAVKGIKRTLSVPARLPEADWTGRFADLERLAGSVADQRLSLVEQWQRLAICVAHWQREREEAATELDQLAHCLMEQAESLGRRDQEQQLVAAELRQRHEAAAQLRHEMIAWRARLRAREHAWEGERQKALTEAQYRESLAGQQHGLLVDLRQRWVLKRQLELNQLHDDRRALQKLRAEAEQARQQTAQLAFVLEEEKRLVAEKTLRLEQFRQELLGKTEQVAAERKLERLRRRWSTQVELAARRLQKQRDELARELAALERRWTVLCQRADDVTRREGLLAQKEAACEHQQALALTRQTRLQEELRHAETQRQLSEQQFLQMREEVERIARSIFAEPDPPAWSGDIAA